MIYRCFVTVLPSDMEIFMKETVSSKARDLNEETLNLLKKLFNK